MTTHKTLFEDNFQFIKSDYEFDYQIDLTNKLDNTSSNFSQDIINEIVLWKVNRFALIDNDTLIQLNAINPNATVIDEINTRILLKRLIQIKGIQLPMASTILRFRNKNVFQIIDQRVYRIIYKGKKLNLKSYLNDKNINDQIDLYLNYLKDLKNTCEKFKIPFDQSDRILFMADRRINKNIPIDNY